MTTQASADTQAPTVPTGLSGNAVSASQIDLSWTASNDNVGVTGYEVRRDGVLITTTANTSFSDTGLTASTGYAYTVAARDAAGNVSAQSAAVNVTTQASPDTQAPTVPTGLNGNAISSSQIDLSWTASTDNVGVTRYEIQRNGVTVGTSTTTSYRDSGLAANTSYSYTVAASDAAGNVSAASNPVLVTTRTAPPPTSSSGGGGSMGSGLIVLLVLTLLRTRSRNRLDFRPVSPLE